MKTETLKELERLCKMTTPLPWRQEFDPHYVYGPEGVTARMNVAEFFEEEDATFVVAIRSAMPELMVHIQEKEERWEILNKTLLEYSLDILPAKDEKIAEQAKEIERMKSVLAATINYFKANHFELYQKFTASDK